MAIQGKNFTASLDGVTANDLAKKLDRNKSEYKDAETWFSGVGRY